MTIHVSTTLLLSTLEIITRMGYKSYPKQTNTNIEVTVYQTLILEKEFLM